MFHLLLKSHLIIAKKKYIFWAGANNIQKIFTEKNSSLFSILLLYFRLLSFRMARPTRKNAFLASFLVDLPIQVIVFADRPVILRNIYLFAVSFMLWCAKSQKFYMLPLLSFDLVLKVSKMTKKLKINACLGWDRATFVLYTKFM